MCIAIDAPSSEAQTSARTIGRFVISIGKITHKKEVIVLDIFRWSLDGRDNSRGSRQESICPYMRFEIVAFVVEIIAPDYIVVASDVVTAGFFVELIRAGVFLYNVFR